jgi:hypothetical protein
MAATITQVQNYISSMRVGVADFVDEVCRKERLGHPNMFCARQKVILVSAYMDSVVDYFTPYLTKGISDYSYEDENFFTTEEIRDMMQHINNICGTFYMLDLSEPDQYDPLPTTTTTTTSTTLALPSAPTWVAPGIGDITSSEIFWEWGASSPDVTNYEFQFDVTGAFLASSSFFGSSTFQLTDSLPLYSSFFGRVRAENASGYGDWSQTLNVWTLSVTTTTTSTTTNSTTTTTTTTTLPITTTTTTTTTGMLPLVMGTYTAGQPASPTGYDIIFPGVYDYVSGVVCNDSNPVFQELGNTYSFGVSAHGLFGTPGNSVLRVVELTSVDIVLTINGVTRIVLSDGQSLTTSGILFTGNPGVTLEYGDVLEITFENATIADPPNYISCGTTTTTTTTTSGGM